MLSSTDDHDGVKFFPFLWQYGPPFSVCTPNNEETAVAKKEMVPMKYAMRSHAVRCALLLVAALTVAMPAVADWTSSANNISTSQNVGIATSNPSCMLQLYPTNGGGNIRLFEFATLGTLYSSWNTLLGWNVKASEGASNQMVYSTTNAPLGASAIVLGNDGIAFHSSSASSVAGSPFSAPRMQLLPTGQVGIGTSQPQTPLHIFDPGAQVSSAQIMLESRFAGYGAGITFRSRLNDNSVPSNPVPGALVEMARITGDGEAEWQVGNTNSQKAGLRFFTTVGGATTEHMRLDGPGNLTVSGNITTTNGSITGATVIGAVYQDVAEWVPANSKMDPGTVVVLNPRANNEVMPAAHAYDTSVAGVVSAHPGVILGVGGDSKAQVATTGRVRVKVDASASPIAVGDLLVTSDKSGVAMKSQPVDLGGIRMHRPGTLIGKALEPLASGEGEILVLLSLQ